MKRRSFILTLLSAPLAAVRAVSKIVQGQRTFTTGWMKARQPGDTTKVILHELWIEGNSYEAGALVSFDGGETWERHMMSPGVPLRLDLPPWVKNRIPRVSIRPASEGGFKMYSARWENAQPLSL